MSYLIFTLSLLTFILHLTTAFSIGNVAEHYRHVTSPCNSNKDCNLLEICDNKVCIEMRKIEPIVTKGNSLDLSSNDRGLFTQTKYRVKRSDEAGHEKDSPTTTVATKQDEKKTTKNEIKKRKKKLKKSTTTEGNETNRTKSEVSTEANATTTTVSQSNNETFEIFIEETNSNLSTNISQSEHSGSTKEGNEDAVAQKLEASNDISEKKLKSKKMLSRAMLYQRFRKAKEGNAQIMARSGSAGGGESLQNTSTVRPIYSFKEQEVAAFFRPQSFKEGFSELFSQRNKKRQRNSKKNEENKLENDDLDEEDSASDEISSSKRRIKRSRKVKPKWKKEYSKCLKELKIQEAFRKQKKENKHPTTTEPRTQTPIVEYWKTTKAETI